MDTKVCFKCGEEKDINEFYKHKKMADGHLNKCKECNKADVQKNYRDNIDHFKEYERSRLKLPHRVKAREDYAKTEKGKMAGNKAKKKYTQNNPEKKRASTILCNAIRDGKIKKEPCERCDRTYRIHGHHDDYDQPLKVRWFCPQCHRDYHREMKELANTPF